jgi:hypothetical protein
MHASEFFRRGQKHAAARGRFKPPAPFASVSMLRESNALNTYRDGVLVESRPYTAPKPHREEPPKALWAPVVSNASAQPLRACGGGWGEIVARDCIFVPQACAGVRAMYPTALPIFSAVELHTPSTHLEVGGGFERR